MPRIFSLVNSKGGTGKTTLALILAKQLKSEGIDVALCDLDTQGSCTSLAGNIPVIAFDEIAYSDYQLVIIDNPPYLSDKLPEVFALSDFVLIPLLPSIVDVLAVRQVVQEVISSGALYGLVLNRVKPGTMVTKEVQEDIKRFGFNLLSTTLFDRVSYQRELVSPGGIGSEGDIKMLTEVQSLLGEIFNQLA